METPHSARAVRRSLTLCSRRLPGRPAAEHSAACSSKPLIGSFAPSSGLRRTDSSHAAASGEEARGRPRRCRSTRGQTSSSKSVSATAQPVTVENSAYVVSGRLCGLSPSLRVSTQRCRRGTSNAAALRNQAHCYRRTDATAGTVSLGGDHILCTFTNTRERARSRSSSI